MMSSYLPFVNSVKERHPLIHCITNYVTINDCANILLACGASPIMADDPLEAAEVTALCDGLVLNTGTLHQNTVQSMLLAGKEANRRGIPIVLDPVGAGVSAFRKTTVQTLLEQLQISVIRGNLSEIKALCDGEKNLRGVDVNLQDAKETDLMAVGKLTRSLAQKTGAVVAVTGAVDLISDAINTKMVRNGNPEMTRITGCGCMLSALTGAFCAANPDALLEATTACFTLFGMAGEIAYEQTKAVGKGIGSLHTALLDAAEHLMQTQSKAEWEGRAKIDGQKEV